MTQTSLLGISGSLRKNATNRKLILEAARLFGPCAYTEADLKLPLYDGDLERTDGVPGVVQALADQIAAAHAIVISGPEYNKSITGVLKNALDWVSRVDGNPWLDKPVAIMSAAAGRTGGEAAQYALRLAMVSFRPKLIPGPAVMIAGASNEFDEAGQLSNERYVAGLTELMSNLREAINPA